MSRIDIEEGNRILAALQANKQRVWDEYQDAAILYRVEDENGEPHSLLVKHQASLGYALRLNPGSKLVGYKIVRAED